MTGYIKTLNNILDDGKGNMTITNTSTSTSPTLSIALNGTNKMELKYDITNGIQKYNVKNSLIWLSQSNTLPGFITTLYNTLDDGYGDMSIYGYVSASQFLGTTCYIQGDAGGKTSSVGLTNITSSNGSGTCSITTRSGGQTSNNSWLKIYVGLTAMYIPVWE